MAVTFGLDISHHQPVLDLARARREGCEFCIIKATEGGTFTDDEFAANLARARAAGMLVAAYVYQRSGASAAAHADRVERVVPKDVPVIPDVEDGSGGVDLTLQLVGELRARGYRVPLLYLPRWYWQRLGSPSLAGLPPLWSSRYPDYTVQDLPGAYGRAPASYWDGYGGLPVALLQFTSSARIAGYQPLDANAYRGTRDQLAALLGLAGGGGAALGGAPKVEDTMLIPAGKDDHVAVPCNGRRALFVAAAFGHTVQAHQIVCVKDTPAHPGGDYTTSPWPHGGTFEADRPGPVSLPEGVRHVVLRYTADHPFTAWCD